MTTLIEQIAQAVLVKDKANSPPNSIYKIQTQYFLGSSTSRSRITRRPCGKYSTTSPWRCPHRKLMLRGRYGSELGLFLGMWTGERLRQTTTWLRWWNASGDMPLWSVEQVEQERQRAEQEHQRAETLAARWLELWVNPDQIT